jgi:LysM repeat protein
VQQGEWLYAIARKYSINPADLLAANPQLPSPDALKPGDVLSIPNCNKGNAAARVSPVQPQATLNPATDPATGGVVQPVQPIQPAQATVEVPNPAAPTPIRLSGRVYTVAAGDTLGTIARKFNVTVQAIKQANGMTDDFLSVGQKLKIPEPAQ